MAYKDCFKTVFSYYLILIVHQPSVSLLVLLFLFLGIFALLGTQVFGGKFKERKSNRGGFSKPRANFDSFSESFYAVFQVLFLLSVHT